jgi:plasmid stabilization system protein ParE
MARKVEWTEVAWSDLEEVANYIAKNSRYYAAAFVREVRDAARSLVYLAERGRVVPEYGARDLLALW